MSFRRSSHRSSPRNAWAGPGGGRRGCGRRRSRRGGRRARTLRSSCVTMMHPFPLVREGIDDADAELEVHASGGPPRPAGGLGRACGCGRWPCSRVGRPAHPQTPWAREYLPPVRYSSTTNSKGVLPTVKLGPPTRTANSTGPPLRTSAASRPVGGRTPRTGRSRLGLRGPAGSGDLAH